MDEFDIIARYFAPLAGAALSVSRRCGGDLTARRIRLVVTTDTIMEGVDFSP